MTDTIYMRPSLQFLDCVHKLISSALTVTATEFNADSDTPHASDDGSQVFAGSTTSATRLSHHIPVSRQLASKLLAVASQSLAILPD